MFCGSQFGKPWCSTFFPPDGSSDLSGIESMTLEALKSHTEQSPSVHRTGWGRLRVKDINISPDASQDVHDKIYTRWPVSRKSYSCMWNVHSIILIQFESYSTAHSLAGSRDLHYADEGEQMGSYDRQVFLVTFTCKERCHMYKCPISVQRIQFPYEDDIATILKWTLLQVKSIAIHGFQLTHTW